MLESALLKFSRDRKPDFDSQKETTINLASITDFRRLWRTIILTGVELNKI